MEPEANFPFVIRTFDPSSKYRQLTLTGAFVTGSTNATFE